jgi:GT2 family glycosyltransferase
MDTPVETELSIILVNWNSVAYLKKCLDSVQKQSEGLTYEVVVVDSASFDGCDAMMAQNFPEFKFIQSRENLGFAKANNWGFVTVAAKMSCF